MLRACYACREVLSLSVGRELKRMCGSAGGLLVLLYYETA